MPIKIVKKTLSEAFAAAGSFNTVAICPHCGTIQSRFNQLVNNSCGGYHDGNKINSLRVGQCNSCHEPVVGLIVTKPTQDGDAYVDVADLIYPHDVWPDRAPDGFAGKAREDYDEARRVLPISAKAAAVLARRCLQHVIRNKLSIRKRTLFEEIAEAIEKPDLSRPTAERLGHVRQIGNWGAHPITSESGNEADALIEVSKEEAEYTLQVVEMLFDDLYTKPAAALKMAGHIEQKLAGS